MRHEPTRPLSLAYIRQSLHETVIRNVALDTNAACGSRCWFCPVRYYERPSRNLMSPGLFRAVCDQLQDGVERGLVAPQFTLWLSSYNDILIDPHLADRLAVLRDHGWRVTVFSNALGLLAALPLLEASRDVITGYGFDVPAGDPAAYERHTLNSRDAFERVMTGLQRLYALDPPYYDRCVAIRVNGAFDGRLDRTMLVYDLPLGDTDRQVAALRSRLPYSKIEAFRPLCDRAGLLRPFALDNSVAAHRPGWRLPQGATGAIGCGSGTEPAQTRLFGWIHINASASLFGCCHDFLEKSVYGNLRDADLRSLLMSEARVTMIDRHARTDCLRCCFAV